MVTNTRFIFFPFFLSDKFLSGIFQIFLNFRAGAYNADPSEEYNYLYFKSKSWKYEKEYRIIITSRNIHSQILTYPDGVLRSIYFGLNVNEDDKNIIIKEFNNKEHKVKFYQMKRKNGLYELTNERIK